MEISILASADNYGISGVVHLQYLASQDSRFSVRDVQHFDVQKSDEHNDSSMKLYTKELQLIKNSLAKVIVLNCGVRFAKQIFR